MKGWWWDAVRRPAPYIDREIRRYLVIRALVVVLFAATCVAIGIGVWRLLP